MAEPKRYAVDPESIEAAWMRVLFHCEELRQETNPDNRASALRSIWLKLQPRWLG